MSDFFLGMSITLFAMVILNYKFKHRLPLNNPRVMVWIAVGALILSIAFSLDDIVRGFREGFHHLGIEKTNAVFT